MTSTEAVANAPNAPSPSRLDALPSELLIEIFSHLVPRPSTKPTATSEEIEEDDNYLLNMSLRNVKAVCKIFATLAAPLITAHYSDGDFYHLHLNAKQPENWEKVRTVIQDGPLGRRSRPRNETFHKYLKLRDVDAQLGLSEVWDDEDEVDSDDDGEAETDRASPLDSEKFKAELEFEWGVDDPSQSNYERAAVLCLCPNVEEILFGSDLNDSWRRYTYDEDSIAIAPIVAAAKGEPFGRVHSFENLRYLSVDLQHMQIVSVVPVMRLPSLRHLVLEWRNWATSGYNGGETDTALESWGCPDRSSNVQMLELHHVQMPSSIVQRLVESCKALKSFAVNCGFTIFQDDWHRDWFIEVFDKLKEHGRTLTELVATATTVDKIQNAALGAVVLQNFAKLKHLRIPFHLVVGPDGEQNDAPKQSLHTAFPASIVSVELDIHGTTPYDETTELFSGLLQHKDEELSHLERIHVINHTLNREEHDLPEQKYSLPMDLHSLSQLSCSKLSVDFGYTLLQHDLENTVAIEKARGQMLRLPHGEALIEHSTCGLDPKWNELLSRPVGTPLPFRSLQQVHCDEARSNGWLRVDISAEELARSVAKHEPRS